MTTTPYDEPLDVRPFWKVQIVFDPDGNGQDFAYTIGLFDHGLPELHMYARPSLGEDPGADWKFSSRDCCGVMNELASMLVRGSLDVGSSVRREYDGGLAVVEYQVDPAEDKNALQAYGVHPGALVLPVRWSLTRPPEGPLLPLTAEAERLARQRYDELAGRLDTDTSLPRGWELPAEPAFDTGQRFGPLTPLVLARAAQFFQADAGTLGEFVMMASAVDDASSVSWPVVRARGIGRTAGRTAALDALADALTRLFEDGPQDARLRRCEKQVVEDLLAAARKDGADVTRAEMRRGVRDRILGGMLACLSGEVVADVADQETRLWAAGPWQAVSSPDGRPGPDWYASEAVLERVRQVLAGLGVDELMSLGAAHYSRCMAPGPGPVRGLGRYADLRNRLTSWAVISAACCPPAQAVIADVQVGVLLTVKSALGSDAEREHLHGLNDWLECLTSMLVHRARLTAADVRSFAGPVRHLVPRLAEVLDEPV